MPDTRMARYVHYDCMDDEKLICTYADMGIGPAVVFDGAGFVNADLLRAFIADLTTAADWLAAEVSAHRGDR